MGENVDFAYLVATMPWTCIGGDTSSQSQGKCRATFSNVTAFRYGLWSVMSFNILLVGDFAKLNPFVMGTWTNQLAVAINQDALGKGAERIDSNETAVLVAKGPEPDTETGTGGPRARAPLHTAMKVQECGGEPADQQWVFSRPGLLAGTVSNNASSSCLNVEGWQVEREPPGGGLCVRAPAAAAPPRTQTRP